MALQCWIPSLKTNFSGLGKHSWHHHYGMEKWGGNDPAPFCLYSLLKPVSSVLGETRGYLPSRSASLLHHSLFLFPFWTQVPLLKNGRVQSLLSLSQPLPTSYSTANLLDMTSGNWYNLASWWKRCKHLLGQRWASPRLRWEWPYRLLGTLQPYPRGTENSLLLVLSDFRGSRFTFRQERDYCLFPMKEKTKAQKA